MTGTTSTDRRSLSSGQRLSPLERLGLGVERMLMPKGSAPIPGSRPWVPEFRMLDRRREIVIRLLTREFDPRRVRIEISGRRLTFIGAAAVGPEGPPVYRAFKRSVILPQGVLPESCSAFAGKNVLTVRFRKATPASAKSLPREVSKPETSGPAGARFTDR